MTARPFAEHGSDEFNAWLGRCVEEICEAVEEALGGNLLALALCGGYARGEGGVVRVNGSEKPYNDLDFILIVNQKKADIESLLEPIRNRFGRRLGIDIDFSPALTVVDIRRWPHWLLWTDTLLTHRVVYGPADIIEANAPASLRSSPPLIEATRLLINRGTGLLWALRILRGVDSAHDADFVRRNLHKAEIAIGDAVIMAHRRHQARYAGRLELLGTLIQADPEGASFVRLKAYQDALLFRLEPGNPKEAIQPNEDALLAVAERWQKALIYTESKRTGKQFTTAEAYCRWRGLREPELSGPLLWPKNLLRNYRIGRLSVVYPREILYRRLPLLIDGKGPDWAERSWEYMAVWRRYH